jgi:hypothetical protein
MAMKLALLDEDTLNTVVEWELTEEGTLGSDGHVRDTITIDPEFNAYLAKEGIKPTLATAEELTDGDLFLADVSILTKAYRRYTEEMRILLAKGKSP